MIASNKRKVGASRPHIFGTESKGEEDEEIIFFDLKYTQNNIYFYKKYF